MEMKPFKKHSVKIIYIWFSYMRKNNKQARETTKTPTKNENWKKLDRENKCSKDIRSFRQESVKKNILIRSDTLFTLAGELPRHGEHNWRTFRSCSTMREHLINKNVLHNIILLHYFHWKGMKTKTAHKCIPSWRYFFFFLLLKFIFVIICTHVA